MSTVRRPRLALRSWAVLLLCLSMAWPVLADTILMKDGRVIEGTVLGESGGKLKVQTRLGVVELDRSKVKEIKRGKTKKEVFDERFADLKDAGAAFELGTWATEKRMKRAGLMAFEKALEFEPGHEGANLALGRVQYKGVWMTPEERELRMVQDREAEMRAKGLVPYEDRWVTPVEKAKLDLGFVQVDGEWYPFAEAQAMLGLSEYKGEWIATTLARTLTACDVVEAKAGVAFARVHGPEFLVAGTLTPADLGRLHEGATRCRRQFDSLYGTAPGLELFGGELGQVYAFAMDSAPYLATCDHFASLSPYLPPGWGEVVKKTHGLQWWDPYPLSSARIGGRPDDHVLGHSYHQLGHILVNRLGYDGKLLPPWYDEGAASMLEFLTHGRNDVFCRGGVKPPGRGTNAKGGASVNYDLREIRSGAWSALLKEAQRAKRLRPFDGLAQLDTSELEMIDIAQSISMLSWLADPAACGKPGALRLFHDHLRSTRPEAPARVIEESGKRQAAYDAAFGAALGLDWRAADQAWRAWLSKG